MDFIKECRICNNANIKPFLSLGKQPFANSLLNSPDEKENSYPLSLSFCGDCGLVQLNETADPKELFSKYVWVTGTSRTARDYSKTFCDNILSKVDVNGSYVLEVASNDGTFLIPFIQKGYNVLGVDPAENIVDIAISNGVPTACSFFGQDIARQIVEEKGKAKVIFARNVIAHVANLHDFVSGLETCLDDEGLLVLEAHYAKPILEGLQYDSFYHEHLCYFSIKSMENLLKQHNFHIVDVRQGPISGGSLEVYAAKNNQQESVNVSSFRNTEKLIGLNEFNSWIDFAKRVHSHKDELSAILSDLSKTKNIVGYGASARSSTLLNFCGITPDMVSMIADQNPIKHNKYTAGTHIPIYSPDDVMDTNPDYVFITGWNFTDEIINILSDRYSFNGKCIIPLPNKPEIRDLN
ncbi:MAG: class I SAM-dependent methyltransferase [archaeon]|nr:class I SAM-dependent methyltransferase [archaeon]